MIDISWMMEVLFHKPKLYVLDTSILTRFTQHEVEIWCWRIIGFKSQLSFFDHEILITHLATVVRFPAVSFRYSVVPRESVQVTLPEHWLLHSLKLVAVRLSVGYKTWLSFDLCDWII